MEENSNGGKVSGVLELADVETRDGNLYITMNESATFDFTKKSWSSDLVLIVEGTKLYVSKNILSLASPVFFAMFQSDFKEGSSNEMELPGKRKRDVVEFLGCIYPNIISEVSREAALRILPLAEEYQVLQLKSRCENALLDSIKTGASTEQLCQILRETCMYNLERLRVSCVQLLSSKSLEQLLEARQKLHVPAKTSNELAINLINNCMDEKVGMLQACCVEMNDENEALKNFILVEMEKRTNLELNQSKNWKEKLIFVPFLVDKARGSEKIVRLWGKSLSVCIERKDEQPIQNNYRYREVKSMLNLKVALIEESSVTCDVGIRCFIVSGHKGISNKSFFWQDKLITKTQNIECDLVKMSDVSSEDKGFIRDGKLRLLVQLIMSEPV